jgi:hypothetical protein
MLHHLFYGDLLFANTADYLLLLLSLHLQNLLVEEPNLKCELPTLAHARWPLAAEPNPRFAIFHPLHSMAPTYLD